MRKLFHAAAAVLVTALVAAPAKADPVVLDQWYTFGFGPTGSSLVDGTGFVQGVNPPSMPAPDPAWTFTVLDPVELILLDGFAAGDQFSIFNFGVLLGNTSAPTDDGTNCGSDITACLAEDAISKATFLLAPGSYSLTGTVIANTSSSPSGGAGFFHISAVTAVPEPASLGLFGAALAGLALLRRKRRTA